MVAALFVVFMFLVVILLANVLTAIVSDSYKVIQDQRAAIVVWTNRLNFASAMDAIAKGPWKWRYLIRYLFQKARVAPSGKTYDNKSPIYLKMRWKTVTFRSTSWLIHCSELWLLSLSFHYGFYWDS